MPMFDVSHVVPRRHLAAVPAVRDDPRSRSCGGEHCCGLAHVSHVAFAGQVDIVIKPSRATKQVLGEGIVEIEGIERIGIDVLKASVEDLDAFGSETMYGIAGGGNKRGALLDADETCPSRARRANEAELPDARTHVEDTTGPLTDEEIRRAPRRLDRGPITRGNLLVHERVNLVELIVANRLSFS